MKHISPSLNLPDDLDRFKNWASLAEKWGHPTQGTPLSPGSLLSLAAPPTRSGANTPSGLSRLLGNSHSPGSKSVSPPRQAFMGMSSNGGDAGSSSAHSSPALGLRSLDPPQPNSSNGLNGAFVTGKPKIPLPARRLPNSSSLFQIASQIPTPTPIYTSLAARSSAPPSAMHSETSADSSNAQHDNVSSLADNPMSPAQHPSYRLHPKNSHMPMQAPNSLPVPSSGMHAYSHSHPPAPPGAFPAMMPHTSAAPLQPFAPSHAYPYPAANGTGPPMYFASLPPPPHLAYASHPHQHPVPPFMHAQQPFRPRSESLTPAPGTPAHPPASAPMPASSMSMSPAPASAAARLLRPLSKHIPVIPPQKKGNTKRKVDYEALDDKRKEFLERNRKAAMKCRQRKKQQLTLMETKAQGFTIHNEQLDAQLKVFRNEIERLQAALALANAAHCAPTAMAALAVPPPPPTAAVYTNAAVDAMDNKTPPIMSPTASALTSSSRLSEIYSIITNAKINEFSAVKLRLDSEYASILSTADAAAAKNDLIGELDALVQGLKDLAISQTKVHPDVENLEDVVKQLRASHAIARPATARHLIARLRNEIAQGKRRTEYALLYGKVLEEHARFQDKHKSTQGGSDTDSVGSGGDEWDTSVPSASVAAISAKYAAERKATLAEFSERVLAPPKTLEGRDSQAFARYLRDQVFRLDDPAHAKFLDDMRAETKRYGEDLIKSTIAPDAVRSMILALLQTDLLDASRQNALREIKDDPVVHGELAAVLNMQLTNLAVWAWPKEGVRVDLRRAMNGKFRMYMDEDLVTALFLQWVGVVWSIRFKQVFERIHSSVLWASDEELKEATKTGAGVWSRVIKDQSTSVARVRREFVDSTFMAQLPGSMADQEGDQCAYEDNDGADDKPKSGSISSAIKRKQDLVHLLGVDAWFHRVTTQDKPDADPFVVVRTDFEWFGPSLPHGHLLALLDFFGVPQVWQDFFQRFLAAPMLLPVLDQPAGEYDPVPRVRAVGVPMGHSISTLLGETMLFVLDYSVVRVGGVTFARLHDDIWLWGSKADAVQRAWAVCEEFAKVAGLAFNAEKSGSVALGGGSNADKACAGLPQGSIAWGFLKLTADEDAAGKWTIDHAELDTHVNELRARLDAAPTVLSWVNAYNKYVRFIVRNCGSITQRDHAQQVIDALTEFHKRVFPKTGGNPVRELVTRMSRLGQVASTVNAEEIQDAFAHWPLSHGGVELLNPFIEPQAVILAMDDNVELSNGEDMASDKYIQEQLLANDVVMYRNAKKDHQGQQAARLLKRKLAMGDIVDLDVDVADKKRKVDAEKVIAEAKANGIEVPDFPEQDTWIQDRRESHFAHWYHWYTWARTVKEPKTMEDMATSLGGHLEALATEPRPMPKGQRGRRQRTGEPLHETSAYWSWVVGMYGESLVNELGSLSFIPSDVVPRAMVQAVKREKIAQDL
ncbi:hypothetical protein BCR44DRAFT_1461437 [Catenaria anguillulae PL171]|uniref:BZIP domain-containing protein n=1 Tax=Catenaria anguillulae PL171 TaxID=765915 RepID=A0A1Y2HLX9_9FUNG|nr:hypothetical protein BCR44DRAFT_1461437 [Catenaria anguillulae PL171]